MKSAAQAMQYELTGTKKVKDSHSVAIKTAETLGTGTLVWMLVKRHRVGLLATTNILFVLAWVFPEWPNIVKSLFN
jgi:hypothetical protein